MGVLDPASIRDVILVGHGGVGKTTLGEALLLAGGATKTLGSVDEGTSAFDTEPEEVKRRSSIATAFHHVTWKKCQVNLIDTPGYASFIHDASNAMRGATTAVLVLSGLGETRGEDERVLGWAEELGVPRIAFVTGLDRERSSLDAALRALTETLGQKAVAAALPIGGEGSLRGVIDLVRRKAFVPGGTAAGAGFKEAEVPAELADEVQLARERLVEAVAEASDELLEKYLEAGELSEEDLRAGLRAAISTRKLVPVLCGCGRTGLGAAMLLDFVVEECPSAVELGPVVADDPKGGGEVHRQPSASEPFSGQIIKTIVDPFAGKISVLRIFSGTLSGDTTIYNSTRQVKEKLGHLFRVEGKKQTQIERAVAGDLVAVVKLKEAATGDTLCDEKTPTYFPRLREFEPAISFALEAKTKGDEDKVFTGLHRLQEEDPGLHLQRDPQTKEILLGGVGQLHVELAVERLKRKYGADVVLKAPKVPYRETIRGKATAQGRVKKQTGGHGQFADTHLEVERLPRGSGFEFVDKIVGGVIPRNFIPAVEKGVREALGQGVLAGCPVVDVRVTLFDGSYHTVDSSEMAFKTAAAIGFKAAVEKAQPVLLEPLMSLEVLVPDEAMGDVIGDLNSRRGKVLGVEPRGHSQLIRAQVPMAEVLKYAPDLNSMTAGRGSFHLAFSHYDELPAHLADKVVQASRQRTEVGAVG